MTKRIRRSQSQWQQLVEQQTSSGLNAAAFCRQQGLYRKSFYHNRKMMDGASTQLTTSRFIQLKAKPEPVLAPAKAVLDYRQVRLQLPTGIDPVWVADLMKALA